jgi:hypothetical protein
MGGDCAGNFILNHEHGRPMIASAKANRLGRNLQHGWSDGLLLTVPDEQLLARMLRPGQRAESVRYTLVASCREHVSSFWRACRLARQTEQEFQQAMILCYAEKDVPRLEDVEKWGGPRWTKSAVKMSI